MKFRLSVGVSVALCFVLGLAAAAGGRYAWRVIANESPSSDQQSGVGASRSGVSVPAVSGARPDFSLPDIEGKSRHVSEWDGQLLVVNFWATWCAPCREEIPTFIELQERYGPQGLQFVGIAIDKLDNVTAYIEEVGINYPVLLGQLAAIEVGRSYGNEAGGLPFTVVVDRQGQIAFAKSGLFTPEEAESVIESRL